MRLALSPVTARFHHLDAIQRRLIAAIIFIVTTTVALGLVLHSLGKASNLTDIQNLIALNSANLIPTDSWEPMRAAMNWLHQHPKEDVYQGVFFSDHIKFQYPLTSLWPLDGMAALGILSLNNFVILNLFLVIATAVGTAILMCDLAKHLDLPGTWDDPFKQCLLAFLGFVATIFFYPIIKAYSLGQVQVWINCAFVYASIAFLRDRRWLTGALLGLATLIKPQMSLFLLWALVRKEWGLAIAWGVVVVSGVGGSIVLYGFDQLAHYMDVLAFISQHGESYYVNQSVNGLMSRLLQNGNNLDWAAGSFAPYNPLVHAATLVSSLGFIALGVLWNRGGRPVDRIASFLVAGICFTASSPVAWVHHYGIVLPAFAFAFLMLLANSTHARRESMVGLVGLAITYFFVGNLLFWPVNALADTPLNPLQSYLFFAVLALLGYLITLSPPRWDPRWSERPLGAPAPLADDGAEPPLFVDLDGTLIRTDLLIESAFVLIKAKPWLIFLLPVWLLGGKARLKTEIAARVDIDAGTLVYNGALLERLKQERDSGRRLVLATAAHRKFAEAVAAHLGLFGGIIATDGTANLKGGRKLESIQAYTNSGPFDYVGNEAADLEISRFARKAIFTGASPAVVDAARSFCAVEEIAQPRRAYLALLVRALRLHQWLKNLLVFVPLILDDGGIGLATGMQAVGAFVAFGLCASSIYVLNDLMDLAADRAHPRKRFRPFASGELPLSHGLCIVPLLILTSLVLSTTLLPPAFLGVLATYFACSLAYNLLTKGRVIWDVMVLAGLYALRILAGAAATSIVPSFWLLAFSMFLFLSLALVKRYSELDMILKLGQDQGKGRGYFTDDMPILQSLGVSSGYLSVLVIALYINSHDIEEHYSRPYMLWIICPMLLFWIGRVWLQTHRGLMHDDPVVFAARDRWSLVIGAACLAALALGRV